MRILIDELFEINSKEIINYCLKNDIIFLRSIQKQYDYDYYGLLSEFDIILTNATDLIEIRNKRNTDVIIIKMDTDVCLSKLKYIKKNVKRLEKGKIYSLKIITELKKVHN